MRDPHGQVGAQKKLEIYQNSGKHQHSLRCSGFRDCVDVVMVVVVVALLLLLLAAVPMISILPPFRSPLEN